GQREDDRAERGAVGPEEARAPPERRRLVGLGRAERVLPARRLRRAARHETRYVALGRVRRDARELEDIRRHRWHRRAVPRAVKVKARRAHEARKRWDVLYLIPGEVERKAVEGLRRRAAERCLDEGAHAQVKSVTLGRGEHAGGRTTQLRCGEHVAKGGRCLR